jgi:hypothetical protein
MAIGAAFLLPLVLHDFSVPHFASTSHAINPFSLPS